MNELPADLPRWLHLAFLADRSGSSWYVGCGFFFAPILALVSPWPVVTTVLWVLVSLFGLWLGVLGIVLATGFSMVLKSNGEIPDSYWQKVLKY